MTVSLTGNTEPYPFITLLRLRDDIVGLRL